MQVFNFLAHAGAPVQDTVVNDEVYSRMMDGGGYYQNDYWVMAFMMVLAAALVAVIVFCLFKINEGGQTASAKTAGSKEKSAKKAKK